MGCLNPDPPSGSPGTGWSLSDCVFSTGDTLGFLGSHWGFLCVGALKELVGRVPER